MKKRETGQMVPALVWSNEDSNQCIKRLMKQKTGEIIMSKTLCSNMCEIHAKNYQLVPTSRRCVDSQSFSYWKII